MPSLGQGQPVWSWGVGLGLSLPSSLSLERQASKLGLSALGSYLGFSPLPEPPMSQQ